MLAGSVGGRAQPGDDIAFAQNGDAYRRAAEHQAGRCALTMVKKNAKIPTTKDAICISTFSFRIYRFCLNFGRDSLTKLVHLYFRL
jgi:hypothetical protein